MTSIVPLSNFTFLNYPSPPPIPTNIPFTLSTEAITDLWRKPPNLIAANQPTLYTPIHLSAFVSASATFHAPWKALYDQAGLVILFPPTYDGHPHESEPGSKPKPDFPKDHPPAWIKSGIEFVEGIPNRGTVSAPANSWADWSLVPSADSKLTIAFEREGAVGGGESGLGSSLQIFLVEGGEGKERTMVREVTWVFEETLVRADPVVWVGVYLAKPTRDAEGEGEGGRLEVVFEQVEVVVRK